MSDSSRARDEAEKLVATALAAAQLAAKGLGSARQGAQTLNTLSGLAERFLGGAPGDDFFGGRAPTRTAHSFANGSDECCVCPVCRVIAALRDPSPEFTDKLASGASDLAAGIAGVMRAFASTRTREEPTDRRAFTEADLDDEVSLREEDPWRSATRASEATDWRSAPAPRREAATRAPRREAATLAPRREAATLAPRREAEAAKVMAKKAVRKVVAPAEPTGPVAEGLFDPPKKAAPKKAAPKKAAPKKAAPKRAAAVSKVTGKRAAKKAAKKAADDGPAGATTLPEGGEDR